ncbi:MAG: hypothetical protein D6751_08950 [Deltaproteobacteria bacterium]|nr:MAG: hypothetical protein D6751_08950 [Deltaproteobacteria bacterium]
MSPADSQLYQKMRSCNDHYGAMLRFMENLYHDLPKLSPLVVRESMRTLDQMQDQARRLDSELRQLVQQTGLEALPEDLLSVRRRLLDEVQKSNSLLVDLLEGKIVLIESELRRNRQGQTAMNGYRQRSAGGGQLVRVNF